MDESPPNVSRSGRLTYTERLVALADRDPNAVGLVCVDVSGEELPVTFSTLARRSAQYARLLADSGVDEATVVAISLPNSLDHVLLQLATWWLGACILPMNPLAPEQERAAVLSSARSSGRPVFVISENEHPEANANLRDLERAESLPSEPLPRRVPLPGRAIPSGGSSGVPKIIVSLDPMTATPEVTSHVDSIFGRRPGQNVLVIGPLYHTGPSGTLTRGLFGGGRTILMSKFNPGLALDLIARHQIHYLFAVPTQMQRLMSAQEEAERDLSSIEALYHSGAVCPAWLKQRWIECLGPERVFEGFGSTEAIGSVNIRGDEWLEHPGSVGRPVLADVKVLDDDGQPAPVGGVGEVWMRWKSETSSVSGSLILGGHEYWGSPPTPTDSEGYASVGDLGWFDEDGYLHIADRRSDMIITGGVNVYPAEVEAALSEHPDVLDVAVVGVPDDEWGRRVHAVVASSRGSEFVDELQDWCRSRLASAKRPKSYTFLSELPRNEAGKIRRSQMSASLSL